MKKTRTQILAFLLLGLFLFQWEISASTYDYTPNDAEPFPPGITIDRISITKFDLKDMDEKDLCNLLLYIGNNFNGSDDRVTGPECGPCGPIVHAVPREVEEQEIFTKRDPVRSRLVTPAKHPRKMDIPKQANQRIQKTWASTKLAKKQLKMMTKKFMGNSGPTSSNSFSALRGETAREKPVADNKRDFYPDYAHLSADPNSTTLIAPQKPLNFWRVNELADLDDQFRFPYSAIVRVAVVDRNNSVVQCTGAVVGQSTVLTVPQCVEGAQYPPVVFTGYNTGSFEHVFVADQMWIPKRFDSCQPCTYATFPNNPDQGHNLVPFPSEGSYALLHIAPSYFKKNFYFEIGTQTGVLGLGAIYLPDLATLPGFDLRRAGGNQLNILNANVELVFNRGGILFPNNRSGPGFYDDVFNVQGNWAARGAPAIVNFGAAHEEDENPHNLNPLYWFKLRNIVAGSVSCLEADVDPTTSIVSASGTMFGMDFVQFFYQYCDRGCETDCYIDHACGNGRIDDPTRTPDINPFCPPRNDSAYVLDYYPPWWMPEQCDDGTLLNSERPNAHCRADCQLAKCGDGILDNKPVDGRTPEQCDDGDLNNTTLSDCSADCKIVRHFIPIHVHPDNGTVGPCPNFIVVPVLINDTPYANLNLSSVEILIGPSNGDVTVDSDGSVRYTPTCGFGGTDTFVYGVCGSNTTDSAGSCGNATVTITVTLKLVDDFFVRKQLPLNSPPDSSTITIDVSHNISASYTFLFVPPNGFTVTVPPLNGTLTGDSSGLFYYTPDPTFSGDDFFTYQICTDPGCGISGTATVYIRILILATSQYYEVFQTTDIEIDPLLAEPNQNPVDLLFPQYAAGNIPPPSGNVTYVINHYSLNVDIADYPIAFIDTNTSVPFEYAPLPNAVNEFTITYTICAPTLLPGTNCDTANITVFVRLIPGTVSYAFPFSLPNIKLRRLLSIAAFNVHNGGNYTSIINHSPCPTNPNLYATEGLYEFYPVYDPPLNILDTGYGPGEGRWTSPLQQLNSQSQQVAIVWTYTICANNNGENCGTSFVSVALNSAQRKRYLDSFVYAELDQNPSLSH